MNKEWWKQVEEKVLEAGKKRRDVILFLRSDGSVGWENPSKQAIEECKSWRSDWMN